MEMTIRKKLKESSSFISMEFTAKNRSTFCLRKTFSERFCTDSTRIRSLSSPYLCKINI